MAVSLVKTTQNSTVEFAGPAQLKFTSSIFQARYFLDTYMPNWDNNEHPKSYILPPNFRFYGQKLSQKIDLINTDHANIDSSVSKNHQAESAERLVFDCVDQLIKDGIQAPFMAFYNLDMKKIRNHVEKIFPDRNPTELFDRADIQMREFDFILIGPKIGFIVIEVKSSSYDHKKYFQPGNLFLPNDYYKGFEQLKFGKDLLKFLQNSTGRRFDGECTSVLFTPNLEKSRVDNWRKSLNRVRRAKLPQNFDTVTKLYMEHMDNVDEDIGKPYGYSAFHKLIHGYGKISHEIYTAYAPVLACIASFLVIPSIEPIYPPIAMLNRLHFWTDHNVHDAQSAGINVEIKVSSEVEKSLKIDRKVSKIFFLLPDQLKALHGPPRQFIIGAAGTGKTMILQAKALQLLQDGHSVAVLAPWSYSWRYKQLFDSLGFKKYRVFDWRSEESNAFAQLSILFGGKITFCKEDLEEILRNLSSDQLTDLKETFAWVYNWDHAMVDDALDDVRSMVFPQVTFQVITFAMALAKLICRDKVIFVGLDGYLGDNIGYPRRDHLDHCPNKLDHWPNRLDRCPNQLDRCPDQLDRCPDQYLKNLIDNWLPDVTTDGLYSTCRLQQVLRCCPEIFKRAYNNLHWPHGLQPMCPAQGITGVQTRVTTGHCLSFHQALLQLWSQSKDVIERLWRSNIDFHRFAIVVGDYMEIESADPAHGFIQKSRTKYWPNLVNILFSVKSFFTEMCKREWPHVNVQEAHPYPLPELVPETELCADKSALVIEGWYDVSSLEWPIILHASCLPKHLTVDEQETWPIIDTGHCPEPLLP